MALQIAMLMTGLILGGGFGLTQKGLTALVVGGCFGFYLPEIVVWVIKRGRLERIFLGLPDSLNLLVV